MYAHRHNGNVTLLPGAIVSYRPAGSSEGTPVATGVVVGQILRAADSLTAVQRPIGGNRVHEEWISTASILDVVPVPS